jgi:hypothetical protein
MGKHDEKSIKNGKWDKPIPKEEKDNPKGGGKHEKGDKGK